MNVETIDPTKLDPCPWCEQSLDFSDGNARLFCAWCAQFATGNVPSDAVERHNVIARRYAIGNLVEYLVRMRPSLTIWDRLNDTQNFVACDEGVNGSGPTLLDALRTLAGPMTRQEHKESNAERVREKVREKVAEHSEGLFITVSDRPALEAEMRDSERDESDDR